MGRYNVKSLPEKLIKHIKVVAVMMTMIIITKYDY